MPIRHRTENDEQKLVTYRQKNIQVEKNRPRSWSYQIDVPLLKEVDIIVVENFAAKSRESYMYQRKNLRA